MTPKGYPDPTPEELEKTRELVKKWWPFIENFRDDLQELLFQAKQPNPDGFKRVVLRLVAKIDTFVGLDETQFLNKEIGDEPKPNVTSQGAKRTYGHVVPNKAEQRRRQSGGGHKPGEVGYREPHDFKGHDAHPIFGPDDFNVTGGEGIDDDDIPF